MKGVIRKCNSCGEFTLELKCLRCGAPTVLAGPMKFSTNDKFQKFRLEEMEDEDGQNNS